MTPKRTNSPAVKIFVLFLLLFACILVTSVLVLFEVLPGMAGKEFGNPSRSLSALDQALYATRLLMQKDNLLLPADAKAPPRTFTIQDGDTVNLIALHLEDAGIIRDATAFRLYLIYSGGDTRLQSGSFSLSPAVNAVQIASILQDVNAKEVNFRILAGWRLEEVAAGLAVSGVAIKPEEFMVEVTNPLPENLPASLARLKNLEGYMLPGVYRFKRTTRPAEVVRAALQQFDEQVTAELRQAFLRQGLDLNQAVILASIVQRESMVADEQPMLASVFYNRLRKPMKLDSDPTVQYAVGFNSAQKTWWTNPLSSKDLKIDSPYNTYIRTGLPPGPIASPSLSALRAVAYPAQSPYFYFRAKCDGSGLHSFSTTYEEHLNKACP